MSVYRDRYNIMNNNYGSLVLKIKSPFSCLLGDTSKATLTTLNDWFKNELRYFCGFVWEDLIQNRFFYKGFVTKAAVTKLLKCVGVLSVAVKLSGVGLEGREQCILNNYISLSKRKINDLDVPVTIFHFLGEYLKKLYLQNKCMQIFYTCSLSILCWFFGIGKAITSRWLKTSTSVG